MARGHREALLDAAKRLLRERGFSRVTARDLVSASDTNLASIGYHFGNKDALLTEALVLTFREWAARTADAARQAAAPDQPVQERLGAALRRLIDGIREDRALILAAAEAVAAAGRDEMVREQLGAAFRETSRLVASDIEAQFGLDPPAARGLASLLIAVHDGLATQSILDPESMPDTAAILTAVTAIARAGQPGD